MAQKGNSGNGKPTPIPPNNNPSGTGKKSGSNRNNDPAKGKQGGNYDFSI